MSLSDNKSVYSLDYMLTIKACGPLVFKKMQKIKLYETFNIFSDHQLPGNSHKQTQNSNHRRFVCNHWNKVVGTTNWCLELPSWPNSTIYMLDCWCLWYKDQPKYQHVNNFGGTAKYLLLIHFVPIRLNELECIYFLSLLKDYNAISYIPTLPFNLQYYLLDAFFDIYIYLFRKLIIFSLRSNINPKQYVKLAWD